MRVSVPACPLAHVKLNITLPFFIDVSPVSILPVFVSCGFIVPKFAVFPV